MLIDSAAGGFRGWSPEMRATFQQLRDAAASGGVEAALKVWMDGDLLAPAFEQPAVASKLRRIIGDYRGWNWLNDGQEIVPDPLPYDRLDEVRAPTLILAGERDIEDFRNIAEALESGIRGARRHVIAGAGHMSNMEAPSQVNRIIAEFLEGLG